MSYINYHEKVVARIAEELEVMSHTGKQVDKHACMINIQCEQIAETQSLILKQACFTESISANIVTRSNKVTKGAKGPAWYEEEQARRDKKKKK